MNKLLKSIVAATVGVAMAIGAGVGLGREAKAVYADSTYIIGWGTASGSDSTNFTAVNGTVNGILSFSANKNSSSTAPAYNSSNSELRLYYNAQGDGGSITITPASGVTLSAFTMTTSTLPTVKYSVDGGAMTTVSGSNNTYSASDFSASTSLEIKNANTSNTQLRIKTIELTYSISGSATYSVVYDANGATNGTVPVDSKSYEADQLAIVLGNTGNLEKEYYLFDGWNTAADGSGVKYIEDDELEMTSNVTLYAQWKNDPSAPVRIVFGSADGSTKINETDVTGDDSAGNSWNIVTVMNETSFTQQNDYSQVGSSAKPATSISFTTTLSGTFSITEFTAKFGGFSGTAGNVVLKVDDTNVATGSLNSSNDVTISSSSAATGTSLSISVTDISKGVKVYYISYKMTPASSDYVVISGLPNQEIVSAGETLDLGTTINVVPHGSYSSDVDWQSGDENVATVDNLGVVTGVAEGTTNITVTSSDDSSASMTCAVRVTPAGSTVLQFSFATYATENNVSSGSRVTPINLDSHVTASANSSGDNPNTGKIYIGAYTEWRFYTSESGTLKITVDSDSTLLSAKGQIGTSNNGDPTLVVFDIVNNEVTYNPGANFNVKSFEIVYLFEGVEPVETAQDKVEKTNSFASLSYNFEKSGDGFVQVLNNANTINNSTSSYGSWTCSGDQGIVYEGNSAGGHGSIQLRKSTGEQDRSGIVVTSNDNNGLYAKKIIIKWNGNTVTNHIAEFFGSTVKYTEPADLYGENAGTSLGTLTYDGKNMVQEVAVSDNYQFIGIVSASGALYIDSIDIQWGSISYDYDDVAIRFGGKISKELWTELDNSGSRIAGYGLLFSTPEYLGNVALSSKLEEATPDGPNVKKFDMPLATKSPVSDGDNWYWNLYKRVTSDLTQAYVAVAYIRLENGTYVFLKEVSASAKSTAASLIANDVYDLESFDGSLANLACYVEED